MQQIVRREAHKIAILKLITKQRKVYFKNLHFSLYLSLLGGLGEYNSVLRKPSKRWCKFKYNTVQNQETLAGSQTFVKKVLWQIHKVITHSVSDFKL